MIFLVLIIFTSNCNDMPNICNDILICNDICNDIYNEFTL